LKVLLLSLVLITPALPVLAEVSFTRYLEVSAGQGEAESELVLGLAYRDGWDGSIKPGTIAARWCDLGAEQDDMRPAFVLGLLQKENKPIGKDEARAMQCLNSAAGKGDNYARVLLGEMLLEGNGVPVDWRRGSELIRKSALAGFSPAQFRLGVIYLVGDAATPKDDIEALAWFIVASESGSRVAQQLRDKRTEVLGRDAAREAIKRSRALLMNDQTAAVGL
jgi:uncharacterized protein